MGSLIFFLLPSLFAPARTPYGAEISLIKTMGGTVTNDRIKDNVLPNWILSQIKGQNIQKECVQLILIII
jgi:hypothetical protein